MDCCRRSSRCQETDSREPKNCMRGLRMKRCIRDVLANDVARDTMLPTPGAEKSVRPSPRPDEYGRPIGSKRWRGTKEYSMSALPRAWPAATADLALERGGRREPGAGRSVA